MAFQRRTVIGERKILAAVRFGETAGGIIAEIAHMGFPDHRLRKRHVRHMVAVPTIRIGAAEVHDHAAPAVHTGPARPRIGDAVHGTAIAFNQKVVIHAVLVVGENEISGTSLRLGLQSFAILEAE